MDNQRLVLVLALVFVVGLLWLAWQRDYGPQGQPAPTATTSAPSTAEPRPKDVPDAAAPAPTGAADEPAREPAAPAASALEQGNRVHVVTDVLDLEIDTVGGDLRRLRLPAYPVSADRPDTPITLLSDDPHRLFVAQSGLLSQDQPAPNHHDVYQAPRSEYRLGPDQETLTVPLTWENNGIRVTKTYTFHRGQYLVTVTQKVTNTTDTPWKGQSYAQLQHGDSSGSGSFFIRTYRGGAFYDTKEEKMEKVAFDDIAEQELSRVVQGGWAAMLHHYFFSAWIPPQETNHHYYTRDLGDGRYVLGLVTPSATVAPDGEAVFEKQVYAGPKRQDVIGEIAQGLDLTVDYGIFTVLSKPLFWLLKTIHGFVGNWGWSIVLLTILIKAAFYKLSQTSYRSMAHMRRVQPRLQAIKEKYGDDRQRMNQALMDLYKKEKINPLGGCLPIAVQIPVFIALYWVLLESVELRQAPFMLWIQDLTSPDPFYVLPVLMGVSMFAQQRLNPHPLDPIQQKVMMVLPFVFTVFFAFFPAGLVLYWVVNNILSIAQQWLITRQVEGKGAKGKNA